MIRHW